MEQYIGKLNYLFQFCGFSCYSSNKYIRKLLFIPSGLWLIFPTFCIFLGKYVFPVIDTKVYNSSPPMTFYLNMLNYTMRFLSHTFCVFEARIKKNIEISIKNDLDKIETRIYNNFGYYMHKNYKNSVKFIISIFVIVLLIFSFLLYHYCFIKNFWFISLTTYTMLFIFDLQMIVYVIVLVDRIMLLKRCIFAAGENKRALDVVTDFYFQLYALHELICARFKVSFFVRLSLLCLQFTCAVYWIFEIRFMPAYKNLIYCKKQNFGHK